MPTVTSNIAPPDTMVRLKRVYTVVLSEDDVDMLLSAYANRYYMISPARPVMFPVLDALVIERAK